MESEAAYEVKVGTFEGPLELLLHLIKKNEINIYDIPIALITQQYIETLDLMKSLNLSIAGEFLVMAATLIHIKSKTLLPPSESEEGAEEEDPRQELVARLLEYQKFKDAAERLEERESLWREIFQKEPSPSELLPEEIPLTDLSLYSLLDALKNVLARIPDKKVLQVTIDELTVKDRMQFLMERLEPIESILFEDLFEGMRTRHSVVVTFLALLEVIRLGLIRVAQGDVCGPLRLFKTKNLSGEV
ncbi:MAG: segregation/condensation protein A [Candidatus Manganitrophaceae bacterium]|nr:MAG: segregation/condensation protein A [Candidatus Manganitrophaceae bacterium]